MTDPSAGAIQILQRTQPWVRFLSLLGFTIVGLVSLVGLGEAINLGTERVEATPLLLVCPLLSLACFFPAYYLHKYAKRIRAFVAQGHSVQLEAALQAQRAFWRYTGIIVLISIAIVLVGAFLVVVRRIQI
jgi:ABC-type multidrug transport system permease subunit